jgi:type II secretory pathway component PulM
MDNQTHAEVSTRARKDAEAVTTKLTINWEGISPEEIRALAQQALIVKLQGKWREDGIPQTIVVNAADYKIGVRAPRRTLSLAEMLANLSPEERKALLEKFAG